MSLESVLAGRLAAELAEVRPRDGAWTDLRAALEADSPVPLWHRVWDRGLSRRQLLRAAAAAAGSLALPAMPAEPAAPASPPHAPAWPAPDARTVAACTGTVKSPCRSAAGAAGCSSATNST